MRYKVWIQVEENEEGTDVYENVGEPLEGSVWIEGGEAAQIEADAIATRLHKIAGILAGEDGPICFSACCRS